MPTRMGLRYTLVSSKTSILCRLVFQDFIGSLGSQHSSLELLHIFSWGGTYPTCNQLQMFRPILLPLLTGKPACQLSEYPLPSLLMFSQYTAFPATGLKITPSFNASSSTSHSRNLHHSSPTGRWRRGKCVPPPVQLASRYTMKLLTRPLFLVAVLQS